MKILGVDLFTFLLIGLFSIFLGIYLRAWIIKFQTKRLIRDLEKYFGQELPYYKSARGSKDYRKINWDRVLKMLKNEPTTEQIAHWKEFLKRFMYPAK